jgi:hypothetical protein
MRAWPSQPRLRGVPGTLMDLHPSKDTVRYRPKRTPGMRGQAAGPASPVPGAESHRHRTSHADPTQRSESADPDARTPPQDQPRNVTDPRGHHDEPRQARSITERQWSRA